MTTNISRIRLPERYKCLKNYVNNVIVLINIYIVIHCIKKVCLYLYKLNFCTPYNDFLKTIQF